MTCYRFVQSLLLMFVLTLFWVYFPGFMNIVLQYVRPLYLNNRLFGCFPPLLNIQGNKNRLNIANLIPNVSINQILILIFILLKQIFHSTIDLSYDSCVSKFSWISWVKVSRKVRCLMKYKLSINWYADFFFI